VKKLVFFICILGLASILQAQIVLPRPHQASKSDDKVWISNAKDIKNFDRFLKRNGQPQTLLFAKNLNTRLFFETYPDLDEVTQLVFEGNNPIKTETFCDLPSLSHVMFHIDSFNATWLKAINDCQFVTEVSYVFEQDAYVDERWFELKSVTTLNVLGIFSKQQLSTLVPKIKPIKQLHHLRFSTDYTRDLPDNILDISQVKSFGMIDNLSFILSRTFHDLAIEKHFINYWDKESEKSIVLGFDYYSDRVSLETYDFDYLSSIFMDGQMLPYYAFQTPDVEQSITPTEQKQEKTVRAYSLYDTTNRKSKPSLYFELNENIHSLDPNYIPEFEHFVISATDNVALLSKAGYKIAIPGNSMVTKKGDACTHAIDIYFRLIPNLVEFGLTGFPAQFDSFNDLYSISNPTVCMLYASSNNVPLKLKSGFAIDVEMPYVEKRQWQLSKDMPYWYPYNALEGGPLTRYKINAFTDTFGTQSLVDYTSFSQRYFEPSYYYLLDKTDTRVKIPRSLKPSYNPNITDRIYMPHRKGMVREKNEFYLRPGKSLIGARKISFKDTARRKLVFFRIYNKIDQRLFPELHYFRKYVFQYTGSEGRKTFTKALLRGRIFNDIRIFYEPGDTEGLVELKYEDGYVQLPFTVVKAGDKKSKAKQLKRFNKMYAKYQARLNRRELVHAQHLDAYNTQLNDEKPAVGGTQILSITALGSYALAGLDTSANYQSLNLVLTQGSGLPLDIKKIIVVYYQPNYLQYFDQKNISLNFNQQFAIIAIDYKGDMYYITASQCKGLKSGIGSIKSMGTRKVKADFSSSKLLLRNLGFSNKK
jgi:hypothetical protein